MSAQLHPYAGTGKHIVSCYVAHGYSGHGICGSHRFGRILSEAINGDLTRFDVFAKLPSYPFPGGPTRTQSLDPGGTACANGSACDHSAVTRKKALSPSYAKAGQCSPWM
jgi:hypothetical protein